MNTVTLHFKADGQQLIALDSVYSYASNTVDYIIADFKLGDNWTGFDVVTAVWYTDYDCISTVLDGDGVCVVPHEVLTKRGQVQVNLVGADLDEEESDGAELIDRLTTYPLKAILIDANARICGTETAPVTPSQFYQFIAIVKAEVGKVRDIESTVLNPDYTLTINYSDGTSDTVGPIRGEKGETGATGATGNGISKIEKIGTAGLVDTYRITYTNGAHYDYTVTNGAKGDTGNGIESIYLTGTSGAVKTYTILFTNGDTFEYQVTDGEVTFAALDTMLEPLLIKDTASGDIASFPDGQNVYPLRKCTVQIEPIQDLHGYDSPWVGGSHYNQWDEVWELGQFNNTTGEPIPSNECIRSKNFIKVSPSTSYSTTAQGGHMQMFFYDTNEAFISQTWFSVNPFTTPNNAEYMKFRMSSTYGTTYKNDIAINYPSTITTYTPYANICPISGRDSVGVDIWGNNYLDPSEAHSGIGYNPAVGTKITPSAPASQWTDNGDGTFSISSLGSWAQAGFISQKLPLGGVKLKVENVTGNLRMGAYVLDNDFKVVRISDIRNPVTDGGTFAITTTFTNNDTYLAVYISGSGAAASITRPRIYYNNEVDIDTYVPYNGTTTTISLGTTVYGGSDEVVGGVGSDEWGRKNLGDLSWTYSSGSKRFIASLNDAYNSGNEVSNVKADILCEQYKTVTNAEAYSGTYDSSIGLPYYNLSPKVNIKDTRYSDANAFKTAVDGVYIYYRKATPTSFTTEPQTIQTLQGRNNIFSDAGDTEVLYVADTKLYIDKVTS